MDCGLYDFRQDGDRCEWQPSGLWARLGFRGFLFPGVFFLVLGGFAIWIFDEGLLGFGLAAFLFVGAALLLWQAWRFWCRRDVPLTVDGLGRVSYGEVELCPAFSVRCVRVVAQPRAESGQCKVVLEQSDATEVELPGPYFGGISQRDTARNLAEGLAKALKVEMKDSA